jgi:hypothetical protein
MPNTCNLRRNYGMVKSIISVVLGMALILLALGLGITHPAWTLFFSILGALFVACAPAIK